LIWDREFLCNAGHGLVLNEPTVVAVAVDDNRVVAVERGQGDVRRTPKYCRLTADAEGNR
jgi:hypothetical protein